MKKILKIKIIIILVVVLFSLNTTAVYAQIDAGCPPECPGDPGCPAACAPIDGGLLFLLVAAIGIGAKKAYDSKRAQAVSII